MAIVYDGTEVGGAGEVDGRGSAATAAAPTSATATRARTRPGSSRRIAQIADQHRRRGFGDAVGGQHDAEHAAEHVHAEQLRRHQRNDHVLAAEAEAEDDREGVHRAACDAARNSSGIDAATSR